MLASARQISKDAPARASIDDDLVVLPHGASWAAAPQWKGEALEITGAVRAPGDLGEELGWSVNVELEAELAGKDVVLVARHVEWVYDERPRPLE
jgi:hypothetical protein